MKKLQVVWNGQTISQATVVLYLAIALWGSFEMGGWVEETDFSGLPTIVWGE